MAGAALRGPWRGNRERRTGEASLGSSISASVPLPSCVPCSPLLQVYSCPATLDYKYTEPRESFLPLPGNAMGPAKIHRQGYSVGSLPCFVFTAFSLTLTRHLLDSLPRQGYPGWMASSTETVNRAKWAVELQLSPKTPNLDPPFLRLPLRPGIS